MCPCILSGSLHRGCFSVSLLCPPLPFLSTWSLSAALSPMLSTPLSQPSTAHSPTGHRVLTAAGLRLQSPSPLDFRIEGQLYFAMCCSSHSQASPWDHLQEVTWGHGVLFGWDGTTNTPHHGLREVPQPKPALLTLSTGAVWWIQRPVRAAGRRCGAAVKCSFYWCDTAGWLSGYFAPFSCRH